MRTLIKTLWDGLWIMATIDSLFYSVILGPIYLLLGPWAVGYFLEESPGVLFFWGLYVEERLLPATMGSVVALITLAPYFYIIILFVAFHSGNWRLRRNSEKRVSNCFVLFFVVFMSLQIYHCRQIWKKLGFYECLGVLGFVRIFYFCFVFKNVRNLK
jgi:hypothetical protein